MSVQDRIQTLKSRHEELDKKLDMENARPMPDDEVIRTIKHEKLTLKDEMTRMAHA
ncbi:YdcH family protein [Curvivirga aplysinae]|uniref:YdcH family protein n=1 Tax=Curvivirga aplysinae TaxID=2529852 RepID=UPI0012BCF721|nr:YdcH family protein [Curvivirga aplysinae]MTI11483.1 DUF465 domain-containing protein [Curvivirga aplysinae]